MALEGLPKISIVEAVAIGGVPDNGMGEVGAVAAKLVSSTGLRGQPQERVSSRGIPTDSGVYLGHPETAKMSDSVSFTVVLGRGHGVVDDASLGWMTAHYGAVALLHSAGGELSRDGARRLRVEAEEEHAGGRAIEPMDWVDHGA